MSEIQYEKICKSEFGKINEKLDKLDHRLFEDNGGECLQSKINRHGDWILTQKNMQKWLITLILGAVILSFINVFNNWILKKAVEPIILQTKYILVDTNDTK